MTGTLVRYRVRPDRADENAALVRAVYAELAEGGPPGFRYATFRLEDGVSFLHIAFVADGAAAPLAELAAFRRFQAAIAERCEDPPVVTPLGEPVGSYGLTSDSRPVSTA
jgi:hypothetical protein